MKPATPQPPGRVMALDVGLRRIGVAVSDEGRTLAQPLTVITRAGRDQDVRALAELARRERAALLVLGLARQPDDSLGPMGEKALSLGRRLGRVTGLPVAYVDEAETTAEAQEIMLTADASRASRRGSVDKLAAALILRRYLDGQGREDI